MRRTFTVGQFFDGSTLAGARRITVDEGVVSAIEPHSGPVGAAWAVPGLVDIQMNGWDDVDVASATPDSLGRLDESLWNEGTGTWLGTVVTAPLEVLTGTLARLHSAVLAGSAPGMAGVHTEGPFLGGAPGAHDRRHIVDVDSGFLAQLPPTVRLVTLAPECPGAHPATSSLSSRGVLVSAGHSTCTEDQYRDFRAAGGRMVTHVFNGMSGIHHRDGGLALWALADPEVRLGLIADGRHVRDDLVRVVMTLAAGRVCMVSDSVAWRSEWALANGATNIDGAVHLPNGTLAGSSTSLLGCVRRAITVAGVEPDVAFAAATSVPAGAIGLRHAGRIREGERCDLLLLDETYHLVDSVRGLASGRD